MDGRTDSRYNDYLFDGAGGGEDSKLCPDALFDWGGENVDVDEHADADEAGKKAAERDGGANEGVEKDHERDADADVDQAADLQAFTALGASDPILLAQQLNKPADAAQFYRFALELKPRFPEALLNLGHAFEALGQKDEARLCWTSALEMNPELARGYFHASL